MNARVRIIAIVALLCLLAFGAAGCSGGGSKPTVAPDRCGSLANFAESARQFATFLAGRSFDIDKFAKGDWVRFQLLEIGSRPPDEIRDDVHVLADASSKFVAAISASTTRTSIRNHSRSFRSSGRRSISRGSGRPRTTTPPGSRRSARSQSNRIAPPRRRLTLS
jgi:hypothetical protein